MVDPAALPGYGEEIERHNYETLLDWFVYVRDPREVYQAQPTYFLSEMVFLTVGLTTIIHSFIVGGRWKYLWVATYIHGLVTEMMSFWVPHIDNYWHSQTTVVLLGRRLPLHITMLYPTFMYNAAYAVAHLKLPRWAEPMAAGLTEVLIDLPYDIMAVKFVHWTWHDTDPNIFDRHYHVPWCSYYFHLTFGTAFTLALHFWRRVITGSDDKGYVSSIRKELLCSVLAGLCGVPGGILQFMLLYHPLHDVYGIHTENCVFLIAVTYLLVVWWADRNPSTGSRKQHGEKIHWSVFLIVFNLIIHYGLYLGMAIFGSPESEVSIGLHQTTGPCDHISDVHTAFGKVLKKRPFLCTSDYDESYFDFHCLPGGKPPKNGVHWYTICGTPFPNRAEYVSMISGICLVACIVFYNMFFKSSTTLVCKTHKPHKELGKKVKVKRN